MKALKFMNNQKNKANSSLNKSYLSGLTAVGFLFMSSYAMAQLDKDAKLSSNNTIDPVRVRANSDLRTKDFRASFTADSNSVASNKDSTPLQTSTPTEISLQGDTVKSQQVPIETQQPRKKKKKVTLPEEPKAPADKAPADKAPADKAPADKAPADKAPADKAPADKTPADKVGTAPTEKKETPAGIPAKKNGEKTDEDTDNSAEPCDDIIAAIIQGQRVSVDLKNLSEDSKSSLILIAQLMTQESSCSISGSLSDECLIVVLRGIGPILGLPVDGDLLQLLPRFRIIFEDTDLLSFIREVLEEMKKSADAILKAKIQAMIDAIDAQIKALYAQIDAQDKLVKEAEDNARPKGLVEKWRAWRLRHHEKRSRILTKKLAAVEARKAYAAQVKKSAELVKKGLRKEISKLERKKAVYSGNGSLLDWSSSLGDSDIALGGRNVIIINDRPSSNPSGTVIIRDSELRNRSPYDGFIEHERTLSERDDFENLNPISGRKGAKIVYVDASNYLGSSGRFPSSSGLEHIGTGQYNLSTGEVSINSNRGSSVKTRSGPTTYNPNNSRPIWADRVR